MWIDEFQLLVKKETGEWETIKLESPGFEEWIDDKPKDWNASSPGYGYTLVSKDIPVGKACLLIEDQSESFTGTLFKEFPR